MGFRAEAVLRELVEKGQPPDDTVKVISLFRAFDPERLTQGLDT
jgi:hypothetical protein